MQFKITPNEKELNGLSVIVVKLFLMVLRLFGLWMCRRHLREELKELNSIGKCLILTFLIWFSWCVQSYRFRPK